MRTRTTGIAMLTTAAVLMATPYAAAGTDHPGARGTAAEAAVPEAAPVTEAATAEAALAAAKAFGRKVEVLDQRTETTTTYANPDGTLTTTQAAGPIRMIENGRWVDVDVDLKRDSGGTVRPEAHPEHLALAGAGGTRARSIEQAAQAPGSAARDLISLGSGDRRIAVQWKGGLPAPELDGSRATYRDAVPGADLVVDATRTGFEQYLTLRHRPGRGAPLVLPLKTEGLKAEPGEDGSLVFTDRTTGEQVSTIPAPVMWDASVDKRSLEHTNRRAVPMKVVQDGDGVELRLTPDPEWLADPETRYPVTIDPAADVLDVLFDTWVQGGEGADQSASTDLKIGWPGDSAGTTRRVARSFLTFRTSPFADALVTDAKLKLYDYHSWSCQERGWEVWATGPADTATRWANQPEWKQKFATSTETRSATCSNAGYVSADVTELARTWASAKADTGSVGIRAADENDTYGWKRFYSGEAAEDKIPQLEVTYNYRPRNGANLQAGPPFVSEGGIYRVDTLTPTLRFSTEDADPDDEVRGSFEITDVATQEVVATVTSGYVPASTTASVKVPAGTLEDGHTYSFRTTTYDGTHWANGWSAPATFHVDTAWRMDAATRTLGYANAASEAADVTAATSSDSRYAAVAKTDENTVGVPWNAGGTIDIADGNGGYASLGLPGGTARGTSIGGTVVYSDPAQSVDTVTQPTAEGGVRTLQVIKNAAAPHSYRTALQLPEDVEVVTHDDGSVTVLDGAVPTGTVSVIAGANGKYLSARINDAGDQAGKVRASATADSTWEKFTLEAGADGTYALKSGANGKYVAVEKSYTGDRQGMLRARSDSAGTWEKFTLHKQQDGSYALKALANGKYVTVEKGLTGADADLVRAAADTPGDGQLFTVVPDQPREQVGFFEAPWAKDANGDAVPTRYEVQDGYLVQSVDFTESTAFPVVIDPGFWSTAWKVTKCAASIASFVYGFTPQGSSKKVITAVRLVKKVGFKKTANIIRTYLKRHKLTTDGRKIVAGILGINSIKSNCKF
ncbi:DNRLRE domain-containing protein [Streptomyces leeuwenhoekii]|uniref:DNRLRE domain-containing protein n=1 Tax=Streptomyces leeuwenhoekii TaxID=1437453 RepID=UPI0036964953